MHYQTLLVADMPHGLSVTLNRIEHKNTLNLKLIEELNDLLCQVEKNRSCRIILLRGQQGTFCFGMDFQELISQIPANKEAIQHFALQYMNLLKRLSLSPKLIVSEIDGQVMAGGVGIVAASDLVIATLRSQFSLSEALWGLLPANVLPYLIRRVGFQKAFLMTLTTQTLLAQDAHTINLVDELTDEPQEALRKFTLRINRLDEQTIKDLKFYFRKMWIINETMEQTAVQELARLVQEPRIQNNIKRFVEQGKFPWEAINE